MSADAPLNGVPAEGAVVEGERGAIEDATPLTIATGTV